jgi:hypothetical protein
MTGKSQAHATIRFFIYLVAIVLVNMVGTTLFFRADLTGNKIYSLSMMSAPGRMTSAAKPKKTVTWRKITASIRWRSGCSKKTS